MVVLSTRAANQNPDPNGFPIRLIKVTPDYFVRDMVFLLASMLYLLFNLLVLQKINIYSALGLPLMYLLFVIVVVYQSHRDANNTTSKAEAPASDNLLPAAADQEGAAVNLSFASVAGREREDEIVGIIVEEEKEDKKKSKKQ